MTEQLGPYVYLMLAAGAFSATIAVLTFRRRGVPGAGPLVAINVIGMFWAWTAAFELSSVTLERAVIFHKLQFFAMLTIGIVWFVFAAQYVGRAKWVRPKRLVALSILPLVTLALLWTNHLHGLMFESFTMNTDGSLALLHKVPGPWWWIDSVYTYSLLVGGILVLTIRLVREFGLYRRQIYALLAGVIVPFVADVVYIAAQGSNQINLAPALFAWVGLALYWGFVRYRLLDLAPVAREFVAEYMGDALIVTDNQDRATYVNLAAEELLVTKLSDVVGKPIAEALAGSPGLHSFYEKARETTDHVSPEWGNQGRYYDGRVSPLLDSHGRVRGTILVLRDTTDRKVAELALDQARRELEERVIERTAQLAAEKENLARLNQLAVEIARCETSADVLSVGIRLACAVVDSDAATLWLSSPKGKMRLLRNEGLSQDSWQTLKRLLETSVHVETAIATEDPVCLGPAPGLGFARLVVVPLISRGMNLGSLCLLSSKPDFGTDGETVLLAGAVASQIAVALESARRYEEAQFLAQRDSLTRLLNHRGFSRRLQEQVAACRDADSTFALVMIDVDNFKLFNDAYGHVIGDRVLQEVGTILSSSLRRSDAIARYGGDEFSLVLHDIDAEGAVDLVDSIRKRLEASPVWVDGGRAVPLKMSYGIAVFPHDGSTAAELLAAADANLYRSKRRGGDFITASGSDDAHRPAALGSFSVLDGLVTTVDGKDHYTRRHSDNVTEYSLALAARMGLSSETERALRLAALLHDVGKLGVPDHILRKPAPLTDEEFEAIKNHVTLGELIIQGIPNQNEVLSAVGSHHERYDGKGYPRGLRGRDIPLLGRILAVTDAYSAMTTDRPYRKALSVAKAKAELKRVAGTQLDPQLVDLFLEVLKEDEVREENRVALFASAHS